MEYKLNTGKWTCGNDGDQRCAELGPDWKYDSFETSTQNDYQFPCGWVHYRAICKRQLTPDFVHQACLNGCNNTLTSGGAQYCPDANTCVNYLVDDVKDYLRTNIPKTQAVVDWTNNNSAQYDTLKSQVCDGLDPNKSICYNWCNNTKKCIDPRRNWCASQTCTKRSDLPAKVEDFKQWGNDVVPDEIINVWAAMGQVAYDKFKAGQEVAMSDLSFQDPMTSNVVIGTIKNNWPKLLANLATKGPCIEWSKNITDDKCTSWSADETNITNKKVYWQAQCDYCKDKINTDQCLNWSNNEDMITNAPEIKYQYDTNADNYCTNHPDDIFCSCSVKDPNNVVLANPYCFNFNCINNKGSYRNARYFEKKDSACPNLCLQNITVSANTSIINNIAMIQNCSGFGDSQINQKILDAVKAEVKDNMKTLGNMLILTGTNLGVLGADLTSADIADAKNTKIMIDDIPNKITDYPDVLNYPSYISLNSAIASAKNSVSDAYTTYNNILKLDWTNKNLSQDQASQMYSDLKMKFGTQLQGYSGLVVNIKNWSNDVFTEFTREANNKANTISTVTNLYKDSLAATKSIPSQLALIQAYDKQVSDLATYKSVAVVTQSAKVITDGINVVMSKLWTEKNKNKSVDQMKSEIISLEGTIDQLVSKIGQIKLNEVGLKDIPNRITAAKAMTDPATCLNELDTINAILESVNVTSNVVVIPNPTVKSSTPAVNNSESSNSSSSSSSNSSSVIIWIFIAALIIGIIFAIYYTWTARKH